jgi:RNase P/RNase MRP subunit POP5
LWWLFWVVSIVVVIATQIYTTRAVFRERFAFEDLAKRVARVKGEEKAARGNLELARRDLLKTQGMIKMQEDSLESVRTALKTYEEEKQKRLEKAKQKLSR